MRRHAWDAGIRTRRGVTLIEAVVVIVILAVAIPPSVVMLGEAANDRADAVAISRATTLATAILENISADAASTSTGLGPDAFDTPTAYLNTATTGLRDRLAPVASLYESLGFSYSVSIGAVTGLSAGEITTLGGSSAIDSLRLVTVIVRAPSGRGGTLDIDASVIVGGVTP